MSKSIAAQCANRHIELEGAPELAVWCKRAMVANQIDPGPGHQGGVEDHDMNDYLAHIEKWGDNTPKGGI